MNMYEVIEARRSVRAFQPRVIEPDKLEAVLRAANLAPSAGNLQAYEIHLIQDSRTRQALAVAALGQSFLAQAPVALIFCAHASRSARYGRRGAELYCVQDATVAAAYAQLAATALGLATCWVGAFDDAAVIRAAELPAGQRPVAILPLGYAAENPPPTPRRALTDLVHRH
jgi:nitroreductase